MSIGGANPVGTPSNQAVLGGSSAIRHDGLNETSSNEASSPRSASAVSIFVPLPQLEGRASTLRPRCETPSTGGNPTLAERIKFNRECCEADEHDLGEADREIRAMQEALQAKLQDRQKIEERAVASRKFLEMLTTQL